MNRVIATAAASAAALPTTAYAFVGAAGAEPAGLPSGPLGAIVAVVMLAFIVLFLIGMWRER